MESKKLQKFLEDLDRELHRLDAPILKRLNKGASTDDLKVTFNDIRLPPEVYQLYNWHDGTIFDTRVPIGEFWIFGGAALMSSARAVEVNKLRSGKDDHWTVQKFPLFESRGGEYFLIDCAHRGRTAGMIFFHSAGAVDFDTMISKYDSLETLFNTIVTCFQQGAYFYNNVNRTFGFNPDLERHITRQLNPRSKYWKIF
jgi:hypothetical protein